MRSLKCLKLFALILLSTATYSQGQEYNIADYLYPDVSRRTLTVNPSLSFFDQSGDNGNLSAFDGSTIVQGSYRSNTRALQQEHFYSSNLGFDFDKNDNDLNNVFLNFGVNAAGFNRYYKEEKKFFEMEASGNYNFNSSKLETFSANKTSRFFVGINPQIGWGRVENVTDAWHALRILEELKRAGYIRRDLNNDEITSLANEISRLKNYRHRDWRIENIYEFESLSTYLIENNICSKDDYGMFSILRDAYVFEGFRYRGSGSIFSIGAKGEFGSNSFNGLDNSDLRYNYGATLSYEKFTPLSKDFQFTQEYELEFGRNHFKPRQVNEWSQSWFASLSTSLNLGYYLSARTFFEAGPRLRYFSQFDPDSGFLAVNLFARGLYYVSPRLRYEMTANFNLSRSDSEFFDPIVNSNTSIQFGLSYFVF